MVFDGILALTFNCILIILYFCLTICRFLINLSSGFVGNFTSRSILYSVGFSDSYSISAMQYPFCPELLLFPGYDCNNLICFLALQAFMWPLVSLCSNFVGKYTSKSISYLIGFSAFCSIPAIQYPFAHSFFLLS